MIKISSDIPGRIKVVFSYNPEYVAKIKMVKAHRWHPEEKYWSFPYSKPFLKEILSTFAGEDLDIDPFLQALISQNQKEKSTHSTPRSEARGMLRVDTERRSFPRFKNRGLAPSNVSKKSAMFNLRSSISHLH